jgi:hypothetical protein
MTAAFDKVVDERSTGVTFNLSFRTPDFRKASIGWLRTAYLVAFATLGYLYILRAELDEVRQQIREPTAEILERYCVITRTDTADRRITFVWRPAEFESVMVFSNDCAVFLPSEGSVGTYKRLATLDPWPPGTTTLSGSTAPWPARPAYALDRAALERRSIDPDAGAPSAR